MDDQTVYEQFFDLQQDPWEMNNRIDDPASAAVLSRHKQALQQWERETERSAPLVMR